MRNSSHDGVMKWKHFPPYCPFVREIHRSPVNSTHKGQWRGALVFSLISALNKLLSEQTIVGLVIWDAMALFMTSLWWVLAWLLTDNKKVGSQSEATFEIYENFTWILIGRFLLYQDLCRDTNFHCVICILYMCCTSDWVLWGEAWIILLNHYIHPIFRIRGRSAAPFVSSLEKINHGARRSRCILYYTRNNCTFSKISLISKRQNAKRMHSYNW